MPIRKRFGQHFLTDRNIIGNIIEKLDPQPADHILEIGPGRGALTGKLVGSGCRLDVVEIDRDLAGRLKNRFPEEITIHEADILKFDLHSLESNAALRIIGNLPYNISTPLLFRLFAHLDHIRDLHFMLQLEVVQRLCAAPSTSDYGRLSVMSQYYCTTEKLFTVPATAFHPRPRVRSAMVRLVPRPIQTPAQDPQLLGQLVSQAFSQRRKTLRNALKTYLSELEMISLALDPRLRPENLGVEDYVRCANLVFARDET